MLRVIGATMVLLAAVGCSTTRLTFAGPAGTVMFVDGKPNHLPATMELSRGESSGAYVRHDVRVVATVQGRELRAKGHVDLFGYAESDVDKVAANTCVLDEGNLARIFDGSTVIFRGQSASRQPLYDLVLGRE